jgi:hypothetical protein
MIGPGGHHHHGGQPVRPYRPPNKGGAAGYFAAGWMAPSPDRAPLGRDIRQHGELRGIMIDTAHTASNCGNT